MYRIIDNVGNLHEIEFPEDFIAIAYMRNHWRDFVVSILRSDRITLFDKEKYMLWEIDPATEKEYFYRYKWD